MTSSKGRWGTFFFFAALVLLVGLYFLFFAVTPGRHPDLYNKVLPAVGLGLSGLVLFFGHFSYSRIHSIKVYFIGYSTGCAGMVYFALCKPFITISSFPPVPTGYGELILLTALANLAAAALIPSATKYRVIKSVTLSAVAVEIMLFSIFRFGRGSSLWLAPLLDNLLWLGPVFLAAALLLSYWKIRNEFFLGGITAGCAVMLLASTMSRVIDPVRAETLLLLMVSGTTGFCFVSLVANGFLRMEHRISYDPLLKIYNRDYCSRIITEQANLDVAPPFGIAMIDIDHFKQVNDTYGHQAGDAVLHTVSQAVHRGAGPDGIACRYGGEELAVFFPRKTAGDVTDIIEKIRKEIDKTNISYGRKSIHVTISVGVSCREQYSQPIVDVIQTADKALYAAKEDGRNRVKCLKTPFKA